MIVVGRDGQIAYSQFVFFVHHIVWTICRDSDGLRGVTDWEGADGSDGRTLKCLMRGRDCWICYQNTSRSRGSGIFNCREFQKTLIRHSTGTILNLSLKK